MDNPGWEHWEAVKRIFECLKRTKDMKLVYGDRKANLEGFVDADASVIPDPALIAGHSNGL